MGKRPGTLVSRALLVALLCGQGAAHAERRPAARDAGSELALARSPVLEHRVERGETLSAIAARHGLSIDELLAQNPGLHPDRLREGQTIAIDRDRAQLRYAVLPGDTLTRIAQMHGVSLSELARWNPDLDPNRIRAGQELTIYPSTPASHSESIGAPASGELVHARRLPPGPGYRIRTPERAWGTDETVRGVIHAFAHARRRHPRAPKLAVHDLSLRKGGPIDEHRSHQSGRDVDIAYPQKRCDDGLCQFGRLLPQQLDAELTWTLLHYWLERNLLEAVFIDYRLQVPLYRVARARGATREQLLRWFQYPRGRGEPLGVIRHFPKHDDHMHVRFGCDATDPECKSYRPLLMHAASN